MSAAATFLQHLAESCTDDSFVRLSLTSPTPAAAPLQRILGRLIELRGERCLSFTLREARRDVTENVPLPAAFAWVEQRLGTRFTGASLATTRGDWQLQQGRDGELRLIRHKASHTAPPREHDEAKPTLLGETATPWLAGLGILDAQGRPRARLAGKHTQIARFAEILHHLARDAGFAVTAAKDAAPLSVVDVGCGKGHLTFAVWHLAHHVLQRPVRVLGVEQRDELVAAANSLAQQVAPGELQFATGDIDSAPLPAVDVLIALHACNTATDHAIRRGIEAKARLIVVAPCCHQEVRPQLAHPEPLTAVLQHGMLAERLAEWVTDGLRALVLEGHGYRCKVIEFVGSEHTQKNLLLAAVRRDDGDPGTAAASAAAREAAARLRTFFGVQQQALDPLR
ncbi:MAG: SAM-dependent methyltransferase [Planctomycetes bacterium]|nr:SAM-dependent methyltransferase [Planctomycetota bacterium]